MDALTSNYEKNFLFSLAPNRSYLISGSICDRDIRNISLMNNYMTHPILKEPKTLVESIIQRYATRATNEFDTAGATNR